MIDTQENLSVPVLEATVSDTCTFPELESPMDAPPLPQTSETTRAAPEEGSDAETRRRHAEAGRKGGQRVHQLIQEGKLYEREHGLKRGRQRLRQLAALGKLYEQEHDLRPATRTRQGRRLSRMARQELLATTLECLLRIAKSSYRSALQRLLEAVQE